MRNDEYINYDLLKHDPNRFIDLCGACYQLRLQKGLADCVPTVYEYVTELPQDEIWKYVSQPETTGAKVSYAELSTALIKTGFAHTVYCVPDQGSFDLPCKQISIDCLKKLLTKYVAIGFVLRRIGEVELPHAVLFAGRRPNGELITVDPAGSSKNISGLFAAYLFDNIDLRQFQVDLRRRSDANFNKQ